MKIIELDYSKRCVEEPGKGHNRWYPDIPPAVEADPGEEVVMQTRHAFDGQITPTTNADDLLSADLGLVYPLTGPVYVKGAEPGNLLEVTIRMASVSFYSIGKKLDDISKSCRRDSDFAIRASCSRAVS